jgi:fimbrial chaperone protein
MSQRSVAIGVIAFACLVNSATAASLQLAPVRLDVPAHVTASKINLRNLGKQPINVQVRVFKWSQVQGKESLVETHDVVASPPLYTLQPEQNNVIRIVRVNTPAEQDEGSYRLLVDELPPAGNKPGYAISFVLRYSIPVFFSSTEPTALPLQWSVSTKGAQTIVTVTNTSNTHQRLSSLTLKPQNAEAQSFGKGLFGYVLANSTKQFVLKRRLIGAYPGEPVQITAEGQNGSIQASAEIRAAD